jgi:hypothetical protein
VDAGPLALAAVRAGLVGEPAPAGRRWLPVAASVAAVVAVVGLTATLADSGAGGRQPGFGPQPSQPSAGLTTAPGGGAETKPGQREHTVSAGPEHERAKQLLATLQRAVPDGYTVPDVGTGQPGTGPTSGPGMTMPTIGPDGTGMPAAYYQAVRDEGPYEGYQGYEYLADTIVSRGPRVGSLAARVWVGIPAWSTDPCVLVDRVYWNDGSCRVLTTAGGQRVALVDGEGGPAPGAGDPGDPGRDLRETQWAAYRHPDGTMVLVAQGPGVLNASIPRLDRPVFTPQQLATLAADARFAG